MPSALNHLAYQRLLGYSMLLAIGVLMPRGSLARAEVHEPFESPRTSGKFLESDCTGLAVQRHERQFREAWRGNGCEHVSLRAGFGTYVRYAIPIPPAAVIDELSISLAVRSTRPGLQLLARVVLPMTRSTGTKPVVTWLRGETYERVGQWQQLSLSDPARLLRRQEPSLRFEHGPGLSLAGAFVDFVAVNVYGGPGQTDVWLDELKVTGAVAPQKPVGDVVLASATEPESPVPLECDGNQLLAPTPRFLRAIEYCGEPFQMLVDLGFNAVWFQDPPDAKRVDEAHRAGLWVLASEAGQSGVVPLDVVVPFPSADASASSRKTRSIEVGTSSYATATARRPLQADWINDAGRGVGDLGIVEWATLSSGYRPDRLVEKLTWLGHRWPRMPLLVVLPSTAPVPLQAQWQTLGFPPAEAWYETEQLWVAAVAAAAGGARGIVWRSNHPLNHDQPTARLRRQQLRWVNLQLEVLDPFLSGGRALGRVDTGLPDLIGFGWETDRARLLVLVPSDAEQSYCAASFTARSIELYVPTTASSDRAYWLSETGLVPLASQRIAGGVSIRLEPQSLFVCIVTTQDSQVVAHLADTIRRLRDPWVEAKRALLEATLPLVESILAKLSQTRASEVSRSIQQVTDTLNMASSLGARGDYAGAHRYLDEASIYLARLRRGTWERFVRVFPNSGASPFCILFSTLPWHQQLRQDWQGRSWSANLLPEGDMEDLSRMLSAGWRRVDRDGLPDVVVRLTGEEAHSGRTALYLTVVQKGALACAPAEYAPVEIVSAPLAVKAGQCLLVRGWARVTAKNRFRGGLVIDDSMGGPLLAEYLSPSPVWQPWSLYRVMPKEGVFYVRFRLDGCAEAYIDDVTVQLLEPIPSERELK